MTMTSAYPNRKLVVIQLTGGNDGLNTLVPFENDFYHQLRPNLRLKKSDLIAINDLYGFNKNLHGLTRLFRDGKLSVINNVGYPNASRSHFRSMDVWQSGIVEDKNKLTGWIGRYLDHYGHLHAEGLAAIEVSNLLSLVMEGVNNKGTAISDFIKLREKFQEQNLQEIGGRAYQAISNENLRHVYQTVDQGINNLERMYHQYLQNKTDYKFPSTEISTNLKMVADMLSSNMGTQIYYVSHGSFDTHIKQRIVHDRLLGLLDKALVSFLQAVKKLGKDQEICVLIFSEFGRRVAENGSLGTDHGAGNNLYVISNQLGRPGLYNEISDLQNLDQGDVPYEIDFRSVYATIIEDWLGLDSVKILGQRFEKLDLFESSSILS